MSVGSNKTKFMEYGVFTSKKLEVAVTPSFALTLYCSEDKNILGMKLYKGDDIKKTLIAVCERDQAEKTTVYAFLDGKTKITNDDQHVVNLLGEEFTVIPDGLRKIDSIEVIPADTYMPAVSEAGIMKCLRQWRLGNEYSVDGNSMFFQMVTNKIEYVFSIQPANTNIYCGASVNIPYDGGLFGSGQYFRLRNYKDNSAPFCAFYCDIGKDITIPQFEKVSCTSGQCFSTSQGIYWSVKNYTEEKIVLAGCCNDEYVYLRYANKTERFKDIQG